MKQITNYIKILFIILITIFNFSYATEIMGPGFINNQKIEKSNNSYSDKKNITNDKQLAQADTSNDQLPNNGNKKIEYNEKINYILLGFAFGSLLSTPIFLISLVKSRSKILSNNDLINKTVNKKYIEAYLLAKNAFPEWIVSLKCQPHDFFMPKLELPLKYTNDLMLRDDVGFSVLNKMDASIIALILDQNAKDKTSLALLTNQTKIPYILVDFDKIKTQKELRDEFFTHIHLN